MIFIFYSKTQMSHGMKMVPYCVLLPTSPNIVSIVMSIAYQNIHFGTFHFLIEMNRKTSEMIYLFWHTITLTRAKMSPIRESFRAVIR